ncbi:hypothetical protein Cgig2_011850 [Carnegiea gigantea]|uniref:Elongation factor EFG domain-containing protein n=1 Tax=Carnegiea gigantea TaxID=171969 RepID=A0A9Q1Q550_9CARY|nr:hypothetical protein Cgig2_011850 [Carnegiea gigantea]
MTGSYILNSNKGKKERIGRLLKMHANRREDVKVAVTRDIIALAGLKDTITGETLCDPDNPIVLERMDFPKLVIKVTVKPKTKADIDRMETGLIKLAQKDPSFHFSYNEETNSAIINGMGELHLEIIVDRLKREFILAARGSFREGMKKASPKLLEPIIKVKIVPPNEHLGVVSGDLNSSKGQINSYGDKLGGLKIVDALVPLAEMFNYGSTVRSMRKGRASYTMLLAKFDVVPQQIQNQIASKEEAVAA